MHVRPECEFSIIKYYSENPLCLYGMIPQAGGNRFACDERTIAFRITSR